MDQLRALIIDAFTDEPYNGNAAGVVPDAEGLSSSQMAAIAGELGASDTVFFLPGPSGSRRARYFTPTTEVDLCGHATVAGYAHLLEAGVVEPGDHELVTDAGAVAIELEADGTVWFSAGAPGVRAVSLGTDRIGAALGIDGAALQVVYLPVARATTGLAYLVVPVRLLEHLGGADPDLDAIRTICGEVDAVGLYAFSFDTLTPEATLHGRMWAPVAGIPEDPVTGTASAAVGTYLQRFGAIEPGHEELSFEQGHYVGRPGTVRVRLGEEVQVGGRAATALDGHLRAPPAGDDDAILEA